MTRWRLEGCVLLCAALSALAAEPSPKAEAGGRHSLWRIESKGNTVYLLGSVHFLCETNYPLAAVIEDAFDKSKVVAFETDMKKLESMETQQLIMGKAMLPADQTIKDQVSAETYLSLSNHLEEAGMPVLIFNRFKPGLVALTLTVLELQKLGFDPQYGIDKHFQGRAEKAGKRLMALETVEFQVDLVTNFGKEEADALLRTTLKDLKRSRAIFGDLTKAWEKGNSEALESLLNDSMREVPELFKRMVTDRNKSWIPKIEDMIAGKESAIVIVGAGHLAGKDSVVELLRAKGYKVEQL